MRISDCGFKNKDRGAVIDEWFCFFFMAMFDSNNELSERIIDKFSICYFQSEIRSPKSEIYGPRTPGRTPISAVTVTPGRDGVSGLTVSGFKRMSDLRLNELDQVLPSASNMQQGGIIN
jgi:hypothetical protein